MKKIQLYGSIDIVQKPEIKAFIELHVEQSSIRSSGVDIGIVEGIVGQRRCSVKIFSKKIMVNYFHEYER